MFWNVRDNLIGLPLAVRQKKLAAAQIRTLCKSVADLAEALSCVELCRTQKTLKQAGMTSIPAGRAVVCNFR